jgi:hypothetical protein
MAKEFERIVEFLLKLNEKNNVLNKEDRDDLKLYLTYFIEEKEDLLNNMNKLSNLDKTATDKIIASKVHSEIGPISSIFTNIHLALMDYCERLYNMKQFLRKLLYYYKRKAKILNCQQKKCSCSELTIYHQSKHYVGDTSELEQLMELIERHNNYLGENRILNDRLIVKGYKQVAELSALSCEIQAILHALANTSHDDFCALDLLLRLLTEKIGQYLVHIDWINDKITRGMVGVYPDCYRDY